MTDERTTELVPTPPASFEPFFIVGVGASAGGLEAIDELLQNVSFDHMAFVVLQHLSPTHDSMLTHLIARSTKLTVVTATDGMRVEPNRVYVLPPNADLAVLQGVLRLLPQVPGPGVRLPVDFFFRSLADDQGPAAIGIVLSGTGSDGTLGLRAIKAAGGITFVQEPSSAKYDGMPQSALAAGHADFSLPPKGIAEELRWLGTQATAVRPERPRTPESEDQLAKLFVLIRAEFGNDMSQYKPATVHRRIDRRMALNKIVRLEDYVRLVQSSAEELRALYEDMLITVTRFFRDRDPFVELQQQILPALMANRPAGSPLRVWVPACATGEEVYSIAITVLEYLEDHNLAAKVQLFGSDVDEAAIEVARRGCYPHAIGLDVSPARLVRFFIKRDADYQISRRVREMVVFSKHNLYKDPPFSRIDLVSCRNLLIYLQPATQSRVMRVLHHALASNGYLMLGTSESIGEAADLFSLVDRKNKIYAKKGTGSGTALEVGFGPAEPAGRPARISHPTPKLQALADRKMLESYAPPGVIINDRLEILHFRGHTGPFLDPAAGNANMGLLRVVRPELRVELKRLVAEALERNQRVGAVVDYAEDDETCGVKLEVLPLRQADVDTRALLVVFQQVPRSPAAAGDGPVTPDERVTELRQELNAAREAMQGTLDEHATAEEELRSAAELLQSANEELQSTNEELETSKEEMQSTNQELTTVNDELQSRMAELAQTNDDLQNVLLGVDQPVIIVGMDLRIRRYTLAAERLFNLVPRDIGRTIDFLQPYVGPHELTKTVTTVIQTLASAEEQVRSSNHRWYQLRVTPYKTVDHAVRGAVVTFTDIDVRKKATDQTNDVTEYATRFLGGIGHPLLLVDRRLRIAWANQAFYERFLSAPEEIVGSPLVNLGTREWFDGALRDLVTATLVKGTLFRDVPVPAVFQQGKVMKLGGSRIPVSTDAPMALLSFEEL